MQTNAEHQQHDADVGKLGCNGDIGDKAGRPRTYEDARCEITDQRGHLQTYSHESEHQRKTEGCRDRRDQRYGTLHRLRTPLRITDAEPPTIRCSPRVHDRDESKAVDGKVTRLPRISPAGPSIHAGTGMGLRFGSALSG